MAKDLVWDRRIVEIFKAAAILTEEEEIEDDAEGGYFQGEDD